MRKTVSIMLVAVFALALVSAMVPLFPMVSAASPAITLTPASQVPGGSVTISGTGFGATKAVGLGFGAEVQVTNEWMTISGPFDVGNGPYTGFTARLPVKPATFRISINISSTTWFQTASDVAGNGTLNNGLPTGNVTLNYVTGNWTRYTTSPVASSPYYKHICNYTSYEYNVTPVAGVTTNSSGAFTASITVPSIFNGTHKVTAIDAQGNTATALFTVIGSAVKPPMWSKTYGGEGTDSGAGDIIQTSDGGYAISGDTASFGAGSSDYWLIKADAAGNMLWNKTYGGSLAESEAAMCQTSDGGYALAGDTKSFGAGGNDVWLVKTDSAGSMQWNKTYGGTGNDLGINVYQTSDGGYAIAGYTNSFGAGGNDFLLIKTDSAGSMQWNRTYGGTGADYGFNVIQTSDGGYALAGPTTSFGAGGMDIWLVKTDAAGNMQWNKTYGGTGTDYMDQMIRTVEGGYAIAGFTTSFGAGSSDVWLVKTDVAGNLLWNKTYGGTGNDNGFHMMQTVEGGYAIIGSTSSLGAGGNDVWLVKTDAAGNMQWSKTYGGTSTDDGRSLIQTNDGGYALAGNTNSFGAGGTDFYVVKTDASGVLPYKAPPAASAFSSVSVLPGWTWIFFVHSNGGVGAHSYQWYEGSTLLTGQTSMVLTVTKTVPGTYTFYCRVTDSEGTTANSNAVTLTVLG